MIRKVTVTKSWKSDDEKLIFFQDPELMCFSSDSALVKYMPVGSWFWAILKEPAQGKKAYRITEDCGENEPSDEVKAEAPSKSTTTTQTNDGRSRSFALAYAKDWCIAKVQAGQDIRTKDVIDVAILFESYLENGATTKKK